MRSFRLLGPALSLLAILAAPLAVACRGERPSVGTVEAFPGRLRLAYPEEAVLRVDWSPGRRLPELAGDPLVFVHLLDDRGEVVRTFDHRLPGAWKPGDPLSDEVELYQSALAAPLAPGSYRLTLGLYDRDGHRWRLTSGGPEVARDEYQVAVVEVPRDGGRRPRFVLSSSFRAPEVGGDRQVLARRWLDGDGAIEIVDPPGTGSVVLVFDIPGEESGAQIVLEEEASSPTVLVSSSCGTVTCSVSGSGRHRVEVPVTPAGEACRIRIHPNFSLLFTDTLERRTLAIERLAWKPS